MSKIKMRFLRWLWASKWRKDLPQMRYHAMEMLKRNYGIEWSQRLMQESPDWVPDWWIIQTYFYGNPGRRDKYNQRERERERKSYS